MLRVCLLFSRTGSFCREGFEFVSLFSECRVPPDVGICMPGEEGEAAPFGGTMQKSLSKSVKVPLLRAIASVMRPVLGPVNSGRIVFSAKGTLL